MDLRTTDTLIELEPTAALEPVVSLNPEPPAPPKKRNSGRTGATSAAGRARCAQNALKHGGCSEALILPNESIEEWQQLLNCWLHQYQPESTHPTCTCQDKSPAAVTEIDDDACYLHSLEYQFLLAAARSEWHRRRTQRNFDAFLMLTQGGIPYNWTPEQIRKHDLLLRYKTAAEREFQRNYRLLEQHCKAHRPKPAPPQPKQTVKPEPVEPTRDHRTVIRAKDPNSPTGYTTYKEWPPREGVTYPCPTPPEDCEDNLDIPT